MFAHAPHLAMTTDQALLVSLSNDPQPALFVWDTAHKTLVHEITISSFQNSGGLAEIRFIGDTVLLMAIAADGKVIFVDVTEAKLHSRLPTTAPVIQ